MESLQRLKNRINSIGGTRQITQSMRLVSTVRLRVVRERMLANRPFYEETAQMVRAAASEPDVANHRYVRGLKRAGSGAGSGTGDGDGNSYNSDGNSNDTSHGIGTDDGDGYGNSSGSGARISYGDGAIPAGPRNCVIVVGSDRGLCGGFNINVCREAGELIGAFGPARLITVGQKPGDYFARRLDGSGMIEKMFTGISETPFFEDAEEIARISLRLYDSGAVDSICLVYTHYISMLSLQPVHYVLLPFGRAAGSMAAGSITAGSITAGSITTGGITAGGYETGAGGSEARGHGTGAGGSEARSHGTGAVDTAAGGITAGGHGTGAGRRNASGNRRAMRLTHYEPGCTSLLEQATPFYLAAAIFNAILESSVCEQCSRITGMDSAVRNSDDMIGKLTLKYNQARQSSITDELSDIIGGTRALKLKAVDSAGTGADNGAGFGGAEGGGRGRRQV